MGERETLQGYRLLRFYTKQHKNCCGIDLHTNKMLLCILSQEGEILLYREKLGAASFFSFSDEYTVPVFPQGCTLQSDDFISPGHLYLLVIGGLLRVGRLLISL